VITNSSYLCKSSLRAIVDRRVTAGRREHHVCSFPKKAVKTAVLSLHPLPSTNRTLPNPSSQWGAAGVAPQCKLSFDGKSDAIACRSRLIDHNYYWTVGQAGGNLEVDLIQANRVRRQSGKFDRYRITVDRDHRRIGRVGKRDRRRSRSRGNGRVGGAHASQIKYDVLTRPGRRGLGYKGEIEMLRDSSSRWKCCDPRSGRDQINRRCRAQSPVYVHFDLVLLTGRQFERHLGVDLIWADKVESRGDTTYRHRRASEVHRQRRSRRGRRIQGKMRPIDLDRRARRERTAGFRPEDVKCAIQGQ